jgi:hypothetical protein
LENTKPFDFHRAVLFLNSTAKRNQTRVELDAELIVVIFPETGEGYLTPIFRDVR